MHQCIGGGLVNPHRLKMRNMPKTVAAVCQIWSACCCKRQCFNRSDMFLLHTPPAVCPNQQSLSPAPLKFAKRKKRKYLNIFPLSTGVCRLCRRSQEWSPKDSSRTCWLRGAVRLKPDENLFEWKRPLATCPVDYDLPATLTAQQLVWRLYHTSLSIDLSAVDVISSVRALKHVFTYGSRLWSKVITVLDFF